MSPEAKQGYRFWWEEMGPPIYGFLIGVCIMVAVLVVYPPVRGFCLGFITVALTNLGRYLARTRWSGRPVVLITSEAAKVIQDGRYSLKTPSERLH